MKNLKLLFLFMTMFFCACLSVSAADVGDGFCMYTGDDGSILSVVIDQQVLETGRGWKFYDGKPSDGKRITNITTIEFSGYFELYDDDFKCASEIYKTVFALEGEEERFSFIAYRDMNVDYADSYVKYTAPQKSSYTAIKSGECVYSNCRDGNNNSISEKIRLTIDEKGNYNGYFGNNKYDVSTRHNSQFDLEAILYSGKTACPKFALFEKHYFNNVWFGNDESLLIKESNADGREDSVYCYYSDSDTTLEDRDELLENREENPDEIYDKDGNLIYNSQIIDIGAGKELESCDELFGNGKTINLLKDAFKAITIVTPILIIILSILDFVKATAASDEKAIKDAQSKFIKRLIIAVLIFFLPTILNILLNLLGNTFGICGVA